MDPFYGHNFSFIQAFHDWLYYHHVWAVPLLVFIFVVIITLSTMKFYLWWRFDRKNGEKQWKSINRKM